MATVLITGGTGLIGKALTKALLEKGYEVIILTRNAEDSRVKNPIAIGSGISYVEWNIKKQTVDESAISKADFIIHLAGASVAEKWWTKKRKQEIISSRVDSGRLILDSLKRIPNKVKAVISASAIGWYGPDSAEKIPFKETDQPANDFLGKTCQQWEAAIEPVKEFGKRLVKFRTGIVLSDDGGALQEFKKPLKFGIATILGKGKQVISWIHIDDLLRMYMMAIENEKLSGVYNAVAPYPVSNKELILGLAKQSRKNHFIPVHIPSIVLKIVLGEMSIEVLKSATVSCEKIQAEGFLFQSSSIEEVFKKMK